MDIMGLHVKWFETTQCIDSLHIQTAKSKFRGGKISFHGNFHFSDSSRFIDCAMNKTVRNDETLLTGQYRHTVARIRHNVHLFHRHHHHPRSIRCYSRVWTPVDCCLNRSTKHWSLLHMRHYAVNLNVDRSRQWKRGEKKSEIEVCCFWAVFETSKNKSKLITQWDLLMD